MSREGWRGLGTLVRLASARPVITVLLVVFALAALAYTFGHLGFVTSGRDLLPRDPYVQRDEETIPCASISSSSRSRATTSNHRRRTRTASRRSFAASRGRSGT